MLNNHLYSISSLTRTATDIDAVLTLNIASNIFEGHFPGHPVLPGACQLQAVKDVLEEALQQKLQITKAAGLKFINMVDPRQNSELQLKIAYAFKEDSYQISASISHASATCTKVQAGFKPIDRL